TRRRRTLRLTSLRARWTWPWSPTSCTTRPAAPPRRPRPLDWPARRPNESTTPWFGITLAQAELTHAQPEAVEAIAAGADLVRVPVPAGRELSARAQA